MKHVEFGFGMSFCNGTKPSVGVNSDGDVVLVHEGAGGEKRYHIGRLRQATIQWGTCKPAGAGRHPRVAVNKDIAIEVHWNGAHKKMYCRAARVVRFADGDEMAWPDADAYAEGGERDRPYLAFNESGVVVEVHEVWEGPKKVWLEYGVGELKRAGRLHVQWTDSRVRYGPAAAPAIAINKHGTIVDIHRYPAATDLRLFCRIGRVDGPGIRFEERKALGPGLNPSVTITDEGVVILLYRPPESKEVRQLVGTVTPDGRDIAWLGSRYFDDGDAPFVAAAGDMAVEVHEHEQPGAAFFHVHHLRPHLVDAGPPRHARQEATARSGPSRLARRRHVPEQYSGTCPESVAVDL